ncbi:hypothetical protein CWC18_17915 [Pseudoalteromonas aurantia]|uniref:Uncharacterized protein n=1 Tax=Pseudoalteromonas aurantia TaxID=43654 RepID=A0A5S3V9M7_9GAMM|nr:hypothetical protein CWC18_17915 [Pseudoalteromonas aurantia]TMO68526.1 hypothetical protein CWC19_09180 [Pseudoalteromonas aurantia]TMO74183.1 hypothetical protein CWC20_11295 [Pseudoalteromonas aurantia]
MYKRFFIATNYVGAHSLSRIIKEVSSAEITRRSKGVTDGYPLITSAWQQYLPIRLFNICDTGSAYHSAKHHNPPTYFCPNKTKKQHLMRCFNTGEIKLMPIGGNLQYQNQQ